MESTFHEPIIKNQKQETRDYMIYMKQKHKDNSKRRFANNGTVSFTKTSRNLEELICWCRTAEKTCMQ